MDGLITPERYCHIVEATIAAHPKRVPELLPQ